MQPYKVEVGIRGSGHEVHPRSLFPTVLTLIRSRGAMLRREVHRCQRPCHSEDVPDAGRHRGSLCHATVILYNSSTTPSPAFWTSPSSSSSTLDGTFFKNQRILPLIYS